MLASLEDRHWPSLGNAIDAVEPPSVQGAADGPGFGEVRRTPIRAAGGQRLLNARAEKVAQATAS